MTTMKRLFIGIPVKSKIIEKFALKWVNDPLLNQNRMKWVRPENWHVTLYFLGNTPESEIDDLQQFIDESFNQILSFSTNLNEVGVFPKISNPKVLWLGLENIQPLLAGYNRLGELLRQNGFAIDNKPLKPHMTLARINSIEHRDSIESLLMEYGQFIFDSVAINRVVLYESILTPKGPVYQPLFVKVMETEKKEPT